jgi:hypothetical protein
VPRPPRPVVSAALWRRDRDLGDVSVWHEGRFLPIAIVELTPDAADQVRSGWPRLPMLGGVPQHGRDGPHSTSR